MRLGLIGLGRIGSFHAQTLTDLPVVDWLVVTDAVPARTAEVADAHPELILAGVAAGLPVFCEKPVARTMAEGLEVQRRVEAAGVPVQIGYQRRFDAAFTAARDAVTSRELGWRHTVRATTLDPAPPPAASVAVSGGIFRDCSVHDFDSIRWVTGREVVEVYATGANRGDELFTRAGDVDTSAAVLTMDDGTLALRSVEPGVSFPAGSRPSPCMVADALEAGWIAEACTASRQQHQPVRMEEVRT
jgi:myo-inositol 2-dehydrogenase/D-chiro-inositol 1-dehydrogenase